MNDVTRVEMYGDSRYPVDRRHIRDTVRTVVRHYGMGDQPVLVEVSVVGERKMRSLNRQFRNLDEPTDVLSFPTEDFSRAADGVIHLGDVVVSYSMARSEAITMNRLIDTVITEKVVHGVKHLLGEHHE